VIITQHGRIGKVPQGEEGDTISSSVASFAAGFVYAAAGEGAGAGGAAGTVVEGECGVADGTDLEGCGECGWVWRGVGAVGRGGGGWGFV